MPDRRDAFERDLARRLREWTDPAASARPWASAARGVLASAAERPAGWGRLRRPILFATSALVVVAAVVLGMSLANRGPSVTSSPSLAPTPSTQPSAASVQPSPSPAVVATPSPIAGDQLDLGGIAWWDVQGIGFGVVPELSPQPSPAVQPLGYEQLRIGTLDGRVTAMLALSDQWGHWYVSLPTGDQVLVANDFGQLSSIRSIDAATGAMDQLYVTAEVVAAVTAVPGSDAYAYALVERETGRDLGVWLQPRSGGTPRQVDTAPSDANDVNVWRLSVSPDGRTLIAQYCYYGARCITHLVDLSTGQLRDLDGLGWVEGFFGGRALARAIGSGDYVAMDLATLQFEPADAFFPGGPGDRAGTSAAELPDGWRADWPEIPGDSMGQGPAPEAVRLVNAQTGEEVTAPPPTLAWASSCQPIPPRELPSGLAPGSGVQTLEDGVRHVTWASGDDLVNESLGPLPAPDVPSGATNAAIRGTDGRLFYVAPSPLPPEDSLILSVAAIQWEESGCWYRINFGALNDAGDYASRF